MLCLYHAYRRERCRVRKLAADCTYRVKFSVSVYRRRVGPAWCHSEGYELLLSGVPWGGGFGGVQRPRNFEGPTKTCQNQPDSENC